MTKAEYDDFVARFRNFLASNNYDGFACTNYENEFFTSTPCECCRRSFGGNRHQVRAYRIGKPRIRTLYSVCDDCVYFNEYGKLDDETMPSVEDDADFAGLEDRNAAREMSYYDKKSS